MSDDSPPVLESALSLLREGFSVVPCAPGVRYPSIAWTQYQYERASVEQAQEWWGAGDANIAIVTGEISDVTVVDVDGSEGYKSLMDAHVYLPKTRVVKTPHGWHLYYRHVPGVKSRSGVYLHVDVKNDGGCVCVPPSHVPDGEYAVFRDYPIAEWTLPVALLEPAEVRVVRSQGEREWVSKLLTDGASVGGRNQAAARLTGYLHSKGVAQDIAILLMQSWDFRQNLPPLGDKEVTNTVRSVYRYRGVLNLDEFYQDEA